MSAYTLNQGSGTHRTGGRPLGSLLNKKAREYNWTPEDIETMPTDAFLIYWKTVEARIRSGGGSCSAPNKDGRFSANYTLVAAVKKRAEAEGLCTTALPSMPRPKTIPINAPKLAAAILRKRGNASLSELARRTGLLRETIHALGHGQRKTLMPATLEAACAWLGRDAKEFQL